MSKTKTPFLSLASSGSVGGVLTSQKRGGITILRKKPTPTDPYSLPQAYQRWLYQDYLAEWALLPAADKQTWLTAGRPYHMAGLAYFLRDRLKTLPDIAGMWRLDQITGGRALDSSKNLNHGTVFGCVPAEGVIDRALFWDGVDDRIVVPNHSSLQIVGDLTIMVFGSIASWKLANYLVYKHYAWEYDFGIEHWGALYALFFHHGDGAHETKYGYIAAPTLAQRYHFAVVRTASPKEIHFYFDGDFVSTSAYTKTPLPSANDVILGRRGATSIWHGIQDQVIILNRALPAADIKRHSLRRYPS